jgi:hypothetical protein
MSNLKQYIKEVLEELEEMSVAGGIGGVATPLGTGPSGKVRYKSSKSSDKKLRSNSKKSVQYILKHGPSKKRSLKENYNFLFEGTRTPQIENVPKEHLLAFVDHMLGNATEGYDISMTEKLSGQHVSILLEGTSTGKNNVYAATKDNFDKVKSLLVEKGKPASKVDVMKATYKDLYTKEEFKLQKYRGDKVSSRFVRSIHFGVFFRSRGASPSIKKAFIFSYPHSLAEGEYRYFGIESIKADYRKGDYISYDVKGRKEYASVYEGQFSAEDSDAMTNPKYNIVFLSPKQLERLPSITQELTSKLQEIKQKLEMAPKARYKSYIAREVKPQIIDLLLTNLSGSLISSNSPFEGLFVAIKDKIGFKIVNPNYQNIQRIQAPFIPAFDRNQVPVAKAASSLYDVVMATKTEDISAITSDQVRKNSTGFNILNYAKTLTEINIVNNLRIFFSPEDFYTLTSLIASLIDNPTLEKANSIVRMFKSNVMNNKKWHTTSSQEDYDNVNMQKIKDTFEVLASVIDEIKKLKK